MGNWDGIVTTGASAHANNGGGFDPVTYVGTLAQLLGANDGPVCTDAAATYVQATGVTTCSGVNNFTNAQIGMIAKVVSGSGGTVAGYYLISAVNGTTTITLPTTVAAANETIVVNVAGAMTFAQGVLALTQTTSIAGFYRVHVQKGAYSRAAADANASAGIAAVPLVLKGYNAALGDLDAGTRLNNGRGPLSVVDFPVTTYTANNTYLNFTGNNQAVSNLLVQTTANSANPVIKNSGTGSMVRNCLALNGNTLNSSSAVGIQGSATGIIINCDAGVSGTTTGDNFTGSRCNINCRAMWGQAFGISSTSSAGSMTGNVIYNCANDGLRFSTTTVSANSRAGANTIFNCSDGISIGNAAFTGLALEAIDNHITDCTGWGINSDYDTTGQLEGVFSHNRFRDNTSGGINGYDGSTAYDGWARDQVFDLNAVTTDTGGPETDFQAYKTGTAGGGAAATITLDFEETVADQLRGFVIFQTPGINPTEAGTIISNTAANPTVCTVHKNWTNNPANGDAYWITDLSLKSGAPGIGAGSMEQDIGALQRIPDFPTAANVWHNDTTDGVTGSMSGLDVPKTGGTGSTLLAEDVATGITLDPTGDNVAGAAAGGGAWTEYDGDRSRLRYFGYDLAYS